MRRRAGRWARTALQYAPLCAVTFLAKVSVPPLGAMGLGIDVPLLLVATLAGLASGLLRVHKPRLMMYLLMLAWLGGAQLLQSEPFSPASVALLAALFLPLTLQLSEAPHVPRQRASGATPGVKPTVQKVVKPRAGPVGPPVARALRVLAGLAAFFALCGVLQFALQIVVGPVAAFPVEHLLPPAFLIQKFNYLIPIVQGGSSLKSNGIFFLEPSFFSQFMALGLLVELSLARRPLRIALLLAGLAVSYSGTGLVVAAVGALTLVVIKGRWDVLIAGVLVLLVLLLVGETSPLQPLLRRASEFQSAHSSGSARFVAWLDLFDRQWWPEPARVLFGTGAGSFAGYAAMARQPTAEMSFSKMLFEYGVTGALVFFAFLVYAFNSVRAPLAFRLGLCATLLVNGALVAFPVGIAATVLLWPEPETPRGLARTRIPKP